MTQVVVALVDLAVTGPVPSSTFVRFQAVTVTESGTAVVTNTPLEVTVTAAAPTVTVTLPASFYEVTGPTVSTALVQVPDQSTINLSDLLLSHQVSASTLAPATLSSAEILTQAQTAADAASTSATAAAASASQAAAATSLTGITTSQDLDTVTAPGMYVIKTDATKTGAARYPAHVPAAFYATDTTQRQPSTEPLVSVFVNAAGQVVQQIIADVYYENFSTGRVIWYRTASAGSLVGQPFVKDVDLPTVIPSFSAKWVYSAGAWTGFDNTWADGGLLVMSGTASSIDMNAFSTSGANPWMATVVNVASTTLTVTSSGGTPLSVPAGKTASIVVGGTARIIGTTDSSGNPHWALSGDLG